VHDRVSPQRPVSHPRVPLAKPEGIPRYAVVEDTPERLVLERRASRYMLGGILLALGAFPVGAYYATLDGPAWLAVLGWLFVLAGALVVADWAQLTFDRQTRRVSFRSVLRGRYVFGFVDIERTEMETREETTRDSTTDRLERRTVYRLFMIVKGERIKVNESCGHDFVSGLKIRIDSMRRNQ
jgi:hypothetical protein